MYKCLECGLVFEEPHRYQERHGLEYSFERLTCYPMCGGGYDYAVPCDSCGEWFTEDELLDGLCEDCRKEGAE